MGNSPIKYITCPESISVVLQAMISGFFGRYLIQPLRAYYISCLITNKVQKLWLLKNVYIVCNAALSNYEV